MVSPARWALGSPGWLSVAQGEVFVAFDQFSPWFARAGKRLDATDYVELGEILDVVDGLAEGLRSGSRA